MYFKKIGPLKIMGKGVKPSHIRGKMNFHNNISQNGITYEGRLGYEERDVFCGTPMLVLNLGPLLYKLNDMLCHYKFHHYGTAHKKYSDFPGNLYSY